MNNVMIGAVKKAAKKLYKPRTIEQLKKDWPNLYEFFLRSKYKSGQTFKEFVKEFF